MLATHKTDKRVVSMIYKEILQINKGSTDILSVTQRHSFPFFLTNRILVWFRNQGSRLWGRQALPQLHEVNSGWSKYNMILWFLCSIIGFRREHVYNSGHQDHREISCRAPGKETLRKKHPLSSVSRHCLQETPVAEAAILDHERTSLRGKPTWWGRDCSNRYTTWFLMSQLNLRINQH